MKTSSMYGTVYCSVVQHWCTSYMGVKWNILDCFKVLLYYRIIVFFRVIVLKYVVWHMVVSGASYKPAENSQAVAPGVASYLHFNINHHQWSIQLSTICRHD